MSEQFVEALPGEVDAGFGGRAWLLEVVVRWGETVVSVHRSSPPRGFRVGEGGCDFVAPTSLVAGGWLVRVGDGVVTVVPPAGAGCVVELGSEAFVAREAVALSLGSRAIVDVGALRFEVRLDEATQVARSRLSRSVLGAVGASAVAHVAMLGVLALFTPPLEIRAEDDLDGSREVRIAQLLDAAAERERGSILDSDGKQTPGGFGGVGPRSSGEEGAQGSAVAATRPARRAIAGQSSQELPSRAAALAEASRFGMVGLLHVGQGGDPRSLQAHWGAMDSMGGEADGARGRMWGASVGDSLGNDALGLSGIGEGGGGRGEGLGLDALATIGHGYGCTCGVGFGTGRLGGEKKPSAPRLRTGAIAVGGALPSDVVARVLAGSTAAMRSCYEGALRSNPSVSGRVELRFVIGRDGAVRSAQANSDVLGADMSACFARAVQGLSFPAPEGGAATVVYPVTLTPGG